MGEISISRILVCQFYKEDRSGILSYSIDLPRPDGKHGGIEEYFCDMVRDAQAILISLGDPKLFVAGMIYYRETFVGSPDIFHIEYKDEWIIYREEKTDVTNRFQYWPKHEIKNVAVRHNRIIPTAMGEEKFNELLSVIFEKKTPVEKKWQIDDSNPLRISVQDMFMATHISIHAARSLQSNGILTVGELAKCSPEQLKKEYGVKHRQDIALIISFLAKYGLSLQRDD